MIMSKEFIIYVKGNANTSNLKKIAIFFVILNIKDNLYQFYHAYLPYRFSANTYILQTFFPKYPSGLFIKIQAKSDFWNTFQQSPEKPRIIAEHCFFGSKALLLSPKSIAFPHKKHCLALVLSIFFTKSSPKVF